jgi:hypothetical protein
MFLSFFYGDFYSLRARDIDVEEGWIGEGSLREEVSSKGQIIKGSIRGNGFEEFRFYNVKGKGFERAIDYKRPECNDYGMENQWLTIKGKI